MNPKLCPGLEFACPGMSDDCSPMPCPSGFSGRASASCQLAGQSQFIPSLSVDKPLRVYVLVWPAVEYLTEPSGSVGVEITPDSLVKTEEFVTFFGLRFRRLIVQFTIRNCFFAFFSSRSLSLFHGLPFAYSFPSPACHFMVLFSILISPPLFIDAPFDLTPTMIPNFIQQLAHRFATVQDITRN